MYYLMTKDAYHRLSVNGSIGMVGHEIEPGQLIVKVEVRDAGQLVYLEAEGIEALPDVSSGRAISDDHLARLARYGVEKGHTTLDLSDRLAKVAGRYMRLR